MTRPIRLLLAVLACAALLATGCGDDGDDASPTTAETADASDDTTDTTAEDPAGEEDDADDDPDGEFSGTACDLLSPEEAATVLGVPEAAFPNFTPEEEAVFAGADVCIYQPSDAPAVDGAPTVMVGLARGAEAKAIGDEELGPDDREITVAGYDGAINLAEGEGNLGVFVTPELVAFVHVDPGDGGAPVEEAAIVSLGEMVFGRL